jgi:hypothetical protein
VDDRLIMVGMHRQVYCREPTGTWTVMENGLPAKSKKVTGFEDVAGTSLTSLYAVGWNGEIWKYDGARWKAMSNPARDILTAVCVADDRTVYAVGREGVLYRAMKDRWEALDSVRFDDLWSVACFQGEIYTASLRHLYKLSPAGVLDLIDPLDCPYYGPFSTGPNALWSIGQKAVLSRRGGEWTQLA